MANVIDTLFLELGITGNFNQEGKKAIDTTNKLEGVIEQFSSTVKALNSVLNSFERALYDMAKADEEAGEAIEGTNEALEEATHQQDRNTQSLEKNTKARQKNAKATDKSIKDQKKSTNSTQSLYGAFKKFNKVLVGVTTALLVGTGLDKFVREAAQANIELDNTAKNLGMSANSLASWRGMAEMAGGSAEGMTGYLQNLSNGLTRLTVMGDASITPFFNQLGISLLDGSGKARDLTDILMDLSDRFSKMDRSTAANLAKQMGIDENTFNVLVQGQQALVNYRKEQEKLYRSNGQDVIISKKLNETLKLINQQYNSIKLMLANALAPALQVVADKVSGFFDYLIQHEQAVKTVFVGIAAALTMILIPALWSAATAAVGFLAPILVACLPVIALAAAFALLYNDYETWAKGGKSLFDWQLFTDLINKSKFTLGNLGAAIKSFLKDEYKDLEDTFAAGKAWLKMKGFIDENGVSVKSLKEGFSNLAKDIWNSIVPALKKVGELVSALVHGEWSKAADIAVDIAKDVKHGIGERVGYIVDEVKENAEKKVNTVKNFLNTFGGRSPDSVDKASDSTLSGNAEILANAVSSGEGGYSSVNRGLVNGKNLGSYEEDLSQLSINEILARNKLSANDPRRMNAVGRYQIIASTLSDLKGKLNLTGEEKFTPEMQDKLFLELLPQGVKDYVDGKSDDLNGALTALSKKWASIGVPVDMQGANRKVKAGESYYAGDGGNKANKNSLANVTFALKQMRNSGGLNGGQNGEAAIGLVNNVMGGALTFAQSPLGGANALQNYSNANNMLAMSRPQNVNNNSRVNVVIQDGIKVQSSASTISGTTADATKAMADRISAATQYNMGVS